MSFEGWQAGPMAYDFKPGQELSTEELDELDRTMDRVMKEHAKKFRSDIAKRLKVKEPLGK